MEKQNKIKFGINAARIVAFAAIIIIGVGVGMQWGLSFGLMASGLFLFIYAVF